ncbi:ABC transporter ATP-binding protein [Thermomonas sp.]|uniref:ABC transporter ATP-binding protein n=1 Tax=Thermomonas sp. TaxID=1971895 RepID=UPI0035B313D1
MTTTPDTHARTADTIASTSASSAGNASTPGRGSLRTVAVGKTVALPDGALTILDGISLDIAPGERVAIVGESGSGKTTLLSLLAGLDVPSRGEVWLDGEAIHASDEDARAALRARAVGFVFQNFQLMPAMSALDNVALPLELRGEAGGAAARALLEQVGLGQRLHHLPRQLSGGEQQRVAIARAFATRPRILFADEPTGNLDRKTGLAIEDLLFGMDDARATTVVVVTHDERLAARCDRQLRLDAGRLLP